MQDKEKVIKSQVSNWRIFKLVSNILRTGVNIEEIAYIFEKSIGQFDRKNKGQYYTPKEVVDYIVSYLDIDENTKVIDPACGCGSFLLTVLDKLLSKRENPNFGNIYGVDLNPTAVNITRLSLLIKGGFKKELVNLFEKNIKIGNSLTSNKDLDKLAFQWTTEFAEILKAGGFDCVVGNPPYVTLRVGQDFDPKESLYSSLIKGPVNAATLMIGRALEILKPGGTLAFVLPKTVLYVESYSRLREFLLKNTKLIQVFDLGLKFKDVRGEQIILIAKKEKPQSEHEVEIRILKDKSKPLFEQPVYKSKQNLFLKLNNKILFFENKRYYSVLDKITSGKIELSSLVDGLIFRGLPIGGNSLYIVGENRNGFEQIIRGKSITKFKIRNVLYINRQILSNVSKTKLALLRQKKIVLQNIFSMESGIIAALDDQGILSLDTVTNIIINDLQLAKYILALLNSKLINFFVIYGLYNRSRLTMHTDKAYIGRIPITNNPKKELLKKIIKYVDEALKEEESNKVKEIQRWIDEVVYNIYGLDSNEIKFIEEALQQVISKKSWW